MQTTFIRISAFLIIAFACLKAQSQSSDTVFIDRLYLTTLDKVLDDLSETSQINFIFDRTEMSKITFRHRFFKTPFKDALKVICKDKRLKLTIDANGTYIVYSKNNENLKNVLNSTVYQEPEVKKIAEPAEIEIQGFKSDIKPSKKKIEKTEVEKNETDLTNAEQEDSKLEEAPVNKTPRRRIYQPTKYLFNITGTLKDAKTGETLPFVVISVKGSKIITTSNVDGYFTLLKVPSDTATVTFSYLGYESLRLRLNPNMPVSNVEIELVQQSNNLQEVEITYDKAKEQEIMETSHNDVSIIRINPAKLALVPNLGERDVFRAFQLMPGVNAANQNSAGLYVRGGTPDQNLVLFDGFTMYNVDHMFGFFSAFNYNAIKDVQLFKGGFDAKYGGRLSSVLEMTGKEGNKKKFNIGGDLGLLSANVFTEIPVTDKLSVMFAARRSWTSPLYTTISNEFYNTSTNNSANTPPAGGRGNFGQTAEQTPTSYFYDLNAKITYRPTTKDVLTWSLYNGQDKLDNSRSQSRSRNGFSFSNSITDLTTWGNTGSSLKWSRKWSEKFYANTLVSISNYYSIRNLSSAGAFSTSSGSTNSFSSGTLENNNLNDYSIKTDFEQKLSETNQLEYGVQGTMFEIKYQYSQNDTTSILNRFNTGQLLSAYIQDKVKFFNNKLKLTYGLRDNYFSVTSKNYVEPRASLVYDLTKRIKLKAAYGYYYQFANRVIREDIQRGSRDFWVLSDGKNVPVSHSIHYIAGASYDTQDYFYSIEGYYKPLYNLTQYSLRFNPNPRNSNFEEDFYTGSGVARGVEFLMQKKKGKFSGWMSYTLGDILYNFPIYGVNAFPADQSVTNEFKIVLMYKWRRWDFSAAWIYGTGRPYTAPQGAYTVSLLDGSTKDYFSIGAKNGNRLPDYHKLDVSATYNFLFGNSSPGSISFSIYNLYNRQNVWYKDFQVVNNTITETNINFLGILPNVTLSMKLR